jgi:hypothetical protein
VFNDKSLNIDPGAAYIPPANMQNEIIFDYNQMQESEELLPAEGDEGYDANEYIEIPISDGREKVVTESKKFEESNKSKEIPKASPAKETNQPPIEKDTSAKRKGFLKRVFGKKEQ